MPHARKRIVDLSEDSHIMISVQSSVLDICDGDGLISFS